MRDAIRAASESPGVAQSLARFTLQDEGGRGRILDGRLMAGSDECVLGLMAKHVGEGGPWVETVSDDACPNAIEQRLSGCDRASGQRQRQCREC